MAVVSADRAQRLAALAWANEVRSRRARLKRDVQAGRVSVVSVLADPPAWTGSMRVLDLLLVAPGWGRVKVQRVLRLVGVSPTRLVGELTDRQRDGLAAVLRGEAR